MSDVTYTYKDRNLFVSRLGVDIRDYELPDRPRAKITDIQRVVCEHYGLDREELLSDRRDRAHARPRQVAMWLSRKLTANSFPSIGRRFGNRDHTTVLHAYRKVEELRGADANVRRDSDTLLKRLAFGERLA